MGYYHSLGVQKHQNNLVFCDFSLSDQDAMLCWTSDHLVDSALSVWRCRNIQYGHQCGHIKLKLCVGYWDFKEVQNITTNIVCMWIILKIDFLNLFPKPLDISSWNFVLNIRSSSSMVRFSYMYMIRLWHPIWPPLGPSWFEFFLYGIVCQN